MRIRKDKIKERTVWKDPHVLGKCKIVIVLCHTPIAFNAINMYTEHIW
jgi:hypothetical protein